MPALADKLRLLGGGGKLAAREWRIRCRLGWHGKAASAARHLLYGERRVTVEEAKQIDAAYAKWCAEKFEANSHENAKLIAAISEFAERAARVDAEYFHNDLEALRQTLHRLGQRESQASRTSRPR